MVVHSHLWKARCKQVALESTAATGGVKKHRRYWLGTVALLYAGKGQKRKELLMRKPLFQRLLGEITQSSKTDLTFHSLGVEQPKTMGKPQVSGIFDSLQQSSTPKVTPASGKASSLAVLSSNGKQKRKSVYTGCTIPHDEDIIGFSCAMGIEPVSFANSTTSTDVILDSSIVGVASGGSKDYTTGLVCMTDKVEVGTKSMSVSKGSRESLIHITKVPVATSKLIGSLHEVKELNVIKSVSARQDEMNSEYVQDDEDDPPDKEHSNGCDDVDSISVGKRGRMYENLDNQKGESSENVKVMAMSLPFGSSMPTHLSSLRNSSTSTPALGLLFQNSYGTRKLVGVRAKENDQKMSLCGTSILHLFDKVLESDGLYNAGKKIFGYIGIRDKGGGLTTHWEIADATHISVEPFFQLLFQQFLGITNQWGWCKPEFRKNSISAAYLDVCKEGVNLDRNKSLSLHVPTECVLQRMDKWQLYVEVVHKGISHMNNLEPIWLFTTGRLEDTEGNAILMFDKYRGRWESLLVAANECFSRGSLKWFMEQDLPLLLLSLSRELANEENPKKLKDVLKEGLKFNNRTEVGYSDPQFGYSDLQFRSHLLLWCILFFRLNSCETAKKPPPSCSKAFAECPVIEISHSQVFVTIISSSQLLRTAFGGVWCDSITLYVNVYSAFNDNVGHSLHYDIFASVVSSLVDMYDHYGTLKYIQMYPIRGRHEIHAKVSSTILNIEKYLTVVTLCTALVFEYGPSGIVEVLEKWSLDAMDMKMEIIIMMIGCTVELELLVNFLEKHRQLGEKCLGYYLSIQKLEFKFIYQNFPQLFLPSVSMCTNGEPPARLELLQHKYHIDLVDIEDVTTIASHLFGTRNFNAPDQFMEAFRSTANDTAEASYFGASPLSNILLMNLDLIASSYLLSGSNAFDLLLSDIFGALAGQIFFYWDRILIQLLKNLYIFCGLGIALCVITYSVLFAAYISLGATNEDHMHLHKALDSSTYSDDNHDVLYYDMRNDNLAALLYTEPDSVGMLNTSATVSNTTMAFQLVNISGCAIRTSVWFPLICSSLFMSVTYVMSTIAAVLALFDKMMPKDHRYTDHLPSSSSNAKVTHTDDQFSRYILSCWTQGMVFSRNFRLEVKPVL